MEKMEPYIHMRLNLLESKVFGTQDSDTYSGKSIPQRLQHISSRLDAIGKRVPVAAALLEINGAMSSKILLSSGNMTRLQDTISDLISSKDEIIKSAPLIQYISDHKSVLDRDLPDESVLADRNEVVGRIEASLAALAEQVQQQTAMLDAALDVYESFIIDTSAKFISWDEALTRLEQK